MSSRLVKILVLAGFMLISVVPSGWVSAAVSLDEGGIEQQHSETGMVEGSTDSINRSEQWPSDNQDPTDGVEQLSMDRLEPATVLLTKVLADRLNDGLSLVATGQQLVRADVCETFALGVNSPEKFTVEQYFAVSPAGTIYTIDPTVGPEYIFYAVATDDQVQQ